MYAFACREMDEVVLCILLRYCVQMCTYIILNIMYRHYVAAYWRVHVLCVSIRMQYFSMQSSTCNFKKKMILAYMYLSSFICTSVCIWTRGCKHAWKRLTRTEVCFDICVHTSITSKWPIAGNVYATLHKSHISAQSPRPTHKRKYNIFQNLHEERHSTTSWLLAGNGRTDSIRHKSKSRNTKAVERTVCGHRDVDGGR